jgi:hypothetical protein
MKAITIPALISLLVLSISAYSHADIYATTDAGERIKLNTNGTWQYLEERKEPADDLSYSDDLVTVSFRKCRIYTDKSWNALYIEIQLSVTVVTKTKIIYPNTHSGMGSNYFTLTDSFGNDLNVLNVSPSYRSNSKGLRPGQPIIFKITASNYPVELSTHLVLEIDRSFLDTKLPIIFKIPNDKIDNF